MRIRPCAAFSADFPDDMIEEDGEIVQFGGRGVAEAVAVMLQHLGYDVSPPEHQHEHGWDFEIKVKTDRVWMQISDLGDFILITRYFPGFGLFKKNSDDIYPEMLTRLNGALAGDPRFSNIRWQFHSDVDSGTPGARDPVSE